MVDKIKVLIVDDNVDFSENMRDLVELGGFEATCVRDGEQAINLAKGQIFQIVLMDVKLPGIDGVEAFLKINKIAPQTRIIMMSGYELEDRVAETMQNGALAVIPKPIDIYHLFGLIQKVVAE